MESESPYWISEYTKRAWFTRNMRTGEKFRQLSKDTAIAHAKSNPDLAAFEWEEHLRQLTVKRPQKGRNERDEGGAGEATAGGVPPRSA